MYYTEKEKINILVTLDANYIPYLNVMLASLINSNPDCYFDVYLLHSSINKKDTHNTSNVLGTCGKLIMVDAGDISLAGAPTTSRYPQEIYYRIFAAEYLPDTLDRILYLDPDIIVNGSIKELYNLPMDEYYFAAASHTGTLMTTINSIRLDMDENSPYINSGVMLINLKLLRKEQNFNDVFRFIEKRKNLLLLPDQDIISSLYGSKIYALDTFRYNMTEKLFKLHSPFEKDLDLEWIRRHSVIIHYCGRNKPWKDSYSGQLDVFYKETISRMNAKKTYQDMKHLLLILNPTAGTKKACKHLPEIISVFNQAEYDTHVYVTTCQGDATKAVKQFADNVDLIVCCGGDGTLNETVTGVIETGLQTPIGYIPAGSTNDFANSLHLLSDVVEAAKQIVNGTAQPYDVGKFANRYFTYVASFGAFTQASYATPQSIKNALGHVAYILDGIQELSKIHKEHLRIELDGEVLEDDYLFGAVCNSTSVGRILTLSPELVDMSDGKFEVFLIRAPKDIQELHKCIVALQTRKYDCNMITFRSATVVKFSASPSMAWSLDGEKADGADKICIENLHRRIRLLK